MDLLDKTDKMYCMIYVCINIRLDWASKQKVPQDFHNFWAPLAWVAANTHSAPL